MIFLLFDTQVSTRNLLMIAENRSYKRKLLKLSTRKHRFTCKNETKITVKDDGNLSTIVLKHVSINDGEQTPNLYEYCSLSDSNVDVPFLCLF